MNRRPSLLVIFLTVMVDLIGFGIVLPLLPVFVQHYGGSGLLVGLIMAAFSAMQFVFAPIWGRLSDRIGRRPVLLASTAVASLSYVVFALGCRMEGSAALWVFLISRLVAGACGANLTVAQAYVADITRPEDRSRRMGLIGMAFGLGFTIGPSIGALAVRAMGTPGPGWVAAAICALNFVMASIILKESWTPNAEPVKARAHWDQWQHTFKNRTIALLVVLFFLATLCFACFETTLGLVITANFNLDMARPRDAQIIAYLFTYCGLMGAIVQGLLTGRLVKLLGEAGVIALSLLLVAASFIPLPYLVSWPPMLIAVGLLAIGSSLVRPPLFGLISRLTTPHEQGATLGVAQGAGSLARIVGPIFAGVLLQYHQAAPYLACGALAMATGLYAGHYLRTHLRGLPADAPTPSPAR
ncbi:MAG: MFS transporter [Verrucomicrobia bacterium]|nr:MFS transporter [Verrucomicrobiota bacterium]